MLQMYLPVLTREKIYNPGDVKFKDQNGDGVIDENDRAFLGSAIPKYTFGATANLEYRNFDLSVFFQGQYGNKIYSQVNMDIEGFYGPLMLQNGYMMSAGMAKEQVIRCQGFLSMALPIINILPAVSSKMVLMSV